jgi:hypothetical protein
MNENNFNPRILYTAKLSFKIDGAMNVFHNQQKLKEYMATKAPLQRLFKEFCTQKMKAKKTRRGQVVPNHRRRKDKESESSIDWAAPSQILKK